MPKKVFVSKAYSCYMAGHEDEDQLSFLNFDLNLDQNYKNAHYSTNSLNQPWRLKRRLEFPLPHLPPMSIQKVKT